MQIYYASITDIEQTTMQLDHQSCMHCGKTRYMVSHGFIYKKQGSQQGLLVVGKRVMCSKRYGRSGCGRTVQLYLDSVIKGLKYNGTVLVAFVSSYLSGTSVEAAYQKHTKIDLNPRHAYRWLQRLIDSTSHHRSAYKMREHTPADPLVDQSVNKLASQPPSHSESEPRADIDSDKDCHRRNILRSTFRALLSQFSEPLCSSFQRQLQRSFLS